jgi:hypothetical protein
MRKFAGLVVLVACGQSNNSPIIIDGAPTDTLIDGPPPGPNVVTLEAPDADTLITYRDGSGPWLVPPEATVGEFDLQVTNDYQVVVACNTPQGSDVTLYDRTFADGTTLFAFCDAAPLSQPTTTAITGTMAQAGQVFMGDTANSATAPWSFSLNETLATHDLIAIGTDNRMLIRRGIVVVGPTSVASIDVVADGTTMTAVPLTINGMQSGETLLTEYDFFLTNDFAFLTGSSTTLQIPPASLLQANDFELLNLDLTTSTTSRSANTVFSGTESVFTLMPILTGISFTTSGGVLAASFGTLPPHDGLRLDMFDGVGKVEQAVDATQSWLDATSTTKIAFDAIPPALDPTLVVDLTAPYTRFFEVSDNSTSIGYSSGVSEAVNGPAAPKRTTHRLERRAIAAKQRR